jgi:hypothetical protein
MIFRQSVGQECLACRDSRAGRLFLPDKFLNLDFAGEDGSAGITRLRQTDDHEPTSDQSP